jgi:choline dehydrogenase-like flavoprotein
LSREIAVTCIIVPNDLQEVAYEDPPRIHGALFSGVGFCKPRVIPGDADLRRAADVLNAGKKVAILVGAGALEATDEVLQISDILGAGVSKALLGKAVIPDDAPGCCGSIGLLGTKPSWEMMMNCDCIQGCKVGAKASTLITHVPEALESGAEIRDRSMVSRIDHNRKTNRVTGVSYFDRNGLEHFQKANAVIVSGYAIETPRLLLNSACDGYENGLANSSDTVGRYLMAQAGNVILGRFDEPVRMYKAPPAHALTEEFYETDPSRDFARGFAIQTIGPLPIAFAKQMMAARGSWGWGMRRIMMDYNHWSAFGLLGEILPWPENRVTLAKETDQFGLRVAHVNFDLRDNDKRLIEFGKDKVAQVMRAAGAEEVVQEARYAHLVGAAMGKDPATSVVDGFGRTHDIANLFVCDGSILPTQGSANPGLTIQSLAARTADYLISQGAKIFHSDKRDLTPPPVRRELSPRGTHGGIPLLR